MKSTALVAAAAVCAALGAAPNAAAAGPAITPVASVTGTFIDPVLSMSSPTALNDRGEVVGVHGSGSELHAFAWRRGVLTDLGKLPGGDYSRATALNEHGDIVGYSGMFAADTERPVHAFLWRHGTMTDLGTLGGENSFARAINNQAVVIGISDIGPSSTQSRGFIWRHGVLSEVPSFAGSPVTPVALNERGQVAGLATVSGTMHAVLWTGGRFTDLGPGYAVWLNERGQVLVGSTERGHVQPFLWDRGIKTLLPTSVTSVVGINDRGQVAGIYTPPPGTARHGFLWDHGRMTDLGTLNPVGLNSHGQVLASSLTSFGKGYVWDHGQITELLPVSGNELIPMMINDGGLVAGTGDLQNAAVWQLPHHR